MWRCVYGSSAVLALSLGSLWSLGSHISPSMPTQTTSTAAEESQPFGLLISASDECRPALMTVAFTPTGGRSKAVPENLRWYLQSADQAVPLATLILLLDSAAANQSICRSHARRQGWTLVYDVAALNARMPIFARTLHVYAARWWFFSWVLNDVATSLTRFFLDGTGRILVPPGTRFADAAPEFCAGGQLFQPPHNNVALWYPCVSDLLLSDSRDVVFQGDPFASITSTNPAPSVDSSKPTIYISGEPRGRTIGTCRFNSEWISSIFGLTALNVMYNKTILCAGLILGTVPAFLELVDAGMIPTIAAYKHSIRNGDQGVLNFIASFDYPQAWPPSLLSDDITTKAAEVAWSLASRIRVVVVHAETGWLCTLYQYSFIDGGVPQAGDGAVTGILPPDGGAAPPCAAVHQYDRFPLLVKHYRGMMQSAGWAFDG